MVPVKGAAAEAEAVAMPLQDRGRKAAPSKCSPASGLLPQDHRLQNRVYKRRAPQRHQNPDRALRTRFAESIVSNSFSQSPLSHCPSRA